jgi:hypothetical protein
MPETEKERPGQGAPQSSKTTVSSVPNGLTEDQTTALDIAHSLVEAGVPVFAAARNSSVDLNSRMPFHLPNGWQQWKANHGAVDRWRPGMALAAVCGVQFDVLDTDIQNGGAATRRELEAAGLWPESFGTASTPSGGTHDLIIRTHLAKGVPATGVDLQAGADDGTGRGFVFIAPTVRISKTTGQEGTYRWTTVPDLGALKAAQPSETHKRFLIHVSKPKERKKAEPAKVRPAAPAVDDFYDMAGTFDGSYWTPEQADREIQRLLDEMTQLKAGEIQGGVGGRARRIGRFIESGHITEQDAHARILEAVEAGDVHSDAWNKANGYKWMIRNVILKAFENAQAKDEPFDVLSGERLESWNNAGKHGVPRDAWVDPAALARRAAARRVDLTPYLDGTYTPLIPSVGEHRDCGHQMLYPAKWHTVVALNASGKSWFGLWHVVGELRAGHTVAYAHFEETQPAGTLDRLRLMAPELTIDQIRDRFLWLDCSTAWSPGEFARVLPEGVTLVVLDGINAAATQHGEDPNLPAAVNAYRNLFVTPATKLGAAVLSLGHPPKARDRQGERHGFGSTAWLDVVDGVGFRMEAAPKKPIRRGQDGYSMVWSVKDRYGQVEALGALDESREAGWYKLGAFHVDSSQEGRVKARLGLLDLTAEGEQKDRIDHLAEAVLELLGTERLGGRFGSQRDLTTALKAARVKHSASDLAPALERLTDRGVLVYPEVEGRNRPRPGWLAPAPSDSGSDDYDSA